MTYCTRWKTRASLALSLCARARTSRGGARPPRARPQHPHPHPAHHDTTSIRRRSPQQARHRATHSVPRGRHARDEAFTTTPARAARIHLEQPMRSKWQASMDSRQGGPSQAQSAIALLRVPQHLARRLQCHLHELFARWYTRICSVRAAARWRANVQGRHRAHCAMCLPVATTSSSTIATLPAVGISDAASA